MSSSRPGCAASTTTGARPDERAALPEPAVVAPAGRHLREPRPGPARRLAGWLRDQVPDTLRGRTELGSGPVLLVVALVAAAVAGTVFVVSRMHGESEPVPLRAESPGSAAPVLVPGSCFCRPRSRR